MLLNEAIVQIDIPLSKNKLYKYYCKRKGNTFLNVLDFIKGSVFVINFLIIFVMIGIIKVCFVT
jgi:hypothetical protein